MNSLTSGCSVATLSHSSFGVIFIKFRRCAECHLKLFDWLLNDAASQSKLSVRFVIVDGIRPPEQQLHMKTNLIRSTAIDSSNGSKKKI
jgi:hypothetical protein